MIRYALAAPAAAALLALAACGSEPTPPPPPGTPTLLALDHGTIVQPPGYHASVYTGCLPGTNTRLVLGEYGYEVGGYVAAITDPSCSTYTAAEVGAP
jgi:hypothetical protein